ncbi:uncharacterized protein N0V89_012184 [Didymosphaeria variabile]|uniref:Uncharacterized protein n=1 Tax=Didymosphaeria variabile TaxID=1932322 RepID=A0A9W9C4S5_9PLEO|nr:uncharacterized protein N0V89_012184 [Didymosphaeria variabile]KAJ4344442.1 hypothetical protein N0V89_012184 [Didymosphaeria variabile]
MVQNGASLHNIDRTKAMFNQVMIHRMAEMIAPYVDTPQKLDHGIAAVISAAKRLHGPAPKPQDEDPGSEAAEGAFEDDIEHSVTREDSPQEEASAPTRSFKKKLDRKSSKKQCAQTPGAAADIPTARVREQRLVEVPGGTAEDYEGHNKIDKKVSKSWRWDVEQETVSNADTSNLFRTTGDLFAYHALPIVRRESGPSTKRRFLRMKIEAMLSDMTPAEYHLWLSSRDKLWAGDLTMLQRFVPGESSTTRGFARATPAPCTHGRLREERQDAEPQETLREASSSNSAVMTKTGHPPQIKKEVAGDSSEMTRDTLHGSREEPGTSPHICPAISDPAAEEPRLVRPSSGSTVLKQPLTTLRHLNSASRRL